MVSIAINLCTLNIVSRGWWRWTLVNPDGVAPSRMVGMSASVNFPLYRNVQKFLFWHRFTQVVPEKGRKTVVVGWW